MHNNDIILKKINPKIKDLCLIHRSKMMIFRVGQK